MSFAPNLAKALVASQSEMTDAVKDAKNPFFKSKYADLNSVREAIMPALTKNKLAVFQPVILLDSGKSVIRTTVLHESGESYTADTEVVCAKVNDPQAYGSAISYARRYGLQSMFNVGAVDDDAEIGMGRKNNVVTTATNVTVAQVKAAAPVSMAEAAAGTGPVVSKTEVSAPAPKPFRKRSTATTTQEDAF